jgi:NADPH:quinone reductase-like Zn-dependent oxidoreductase
MQPDLASHEIWHVAQAEPGNAIVVTGAAGGVGTAVLDIARALGVTAVGLASVAKHDIVRKHRSVVGKIVITH